ncbi:sensor histidine kinase [Homoserinimonas aerilata]|nr:sensor histidine kinase [Homoserinimonas aerilata]
MTRLLRSMWNSPRAVPAPPRRVWRDWALLAVIVVFSVIEGLLRTDLSWPLLSVVAMVAVAPTVLWRRTRPSLMLAIDFAIITGFSIVMGQELQLVSGALLVVLPYALFRWGGGRDLILGVAIVVAGLAVSALWGSNWGDALGGVAFVLLLVVIALIFRNRAGSRFRELDTVRLREREQLARDLHDTVAHHVSAIAIRAQAGLAVAERNPDAAADALRVIEAEASKTLTEMRSMVRVLRQGEAAELAPGATIADIQQIVAEQRDGPQITAQITGDADAVPPTVAAAVYRLVQESVTNARRHARGASRIDVLVEVHHEGVRLSVTDDGEPTSAGTPGFGITGMGERAALLGGTLHAGRAAGGGWVVTAVLPRVGWTI